MFTIMIMEIGNIYYFLSLILLFGIPIILCLFLRYKSETTIKCTLLGLAFANFLLHFLKILHPSYQAEMNYSLIRLSLENICGVTSVFLPFAMLSKNKTFKGYFYFIALLGGLMAVLITTDPVGKPITEFNTIRYYVCHYILFSVPVVALVTGEFQPRLVSAIFMPFNFLVGQTIIFLNEVFLVGVGLVEYVPEKFFSPNWRNASFVFGPSADYEWIADVFPFLIPDIFRTNIFGIEGIESFYWPVLWALVPSIIFFPIVYFLICLPFVIRNNKIDCILIIE